MHRLTVVANRANWLVRFATYVQVWHNGVSVADTSANAQCSSVLYRLL